MTAEELINSDSLIVVDGEYTDDTIKQAFSEGYEKGYNQALEDVIALRKRIGNPYDEREGKAMLYFEIEARKLKK